MSTGIALLEFSLSDIGMQEVVSRIRGPEAAEQDVTASVAQILQEVEQGGEAALLELSRKYDGSQFSSAQELLVSEAEFVQARRELEKSQEAALRLAYKQLRFLAAQQKTRFKEKTFSTPFGYNVRERYVPLQRIGGYVPGGLASYPSTVLMICAPAREAGVSSIILATPPRKDGKVNPAVLVAAAICGVKQVLKLGGAQAIAALALGTSSIEKVELIAGPGNQYVTEAKRQLAAQGRVAIDALAGPTELLILADEKANPELLLEDLISQAEHGNKTLCGVVSNSGKVIAALRTQLASIDSRKRLDAIRQATLFAVKTNSVQQAVEFAQAFAPEHLEVHFSDKSVKYTDQLTKAGLVLLGEFAPCAASDYIVGANHILPTGGSASRSAGVSVATFLKRATSVSSSRAALKSSLKALTTLAEMEGLPNHGRAAAARFAKSGSK